MKDTPLSFLQNFSERAKQAPIVCINGHELRNMKTPNGQVLVALPNDQLANIAMRQVARSKDKHAVDFVIGQEHFIVQMPLAWIYPSEASQVWPRHEMNWITAPLKTDRLVFDTEGLARGRYIDTGFPMVDIIEVFEWEGRYIIFSAHDNLDLGFAGDSDDRVWRTENGRTLKDGLFTNRLPSGKYAQGWEVLREIWEGLSTKTKHDDFSFTISPPQDADPVVELTITPDNLEGAFNTRFKLSNGRIGNYKWKPGYGKKIVDFVLECLEEK